MKQLRWSNRLLWSVAGSSASYLNCRSISPRHWHITSPATHQSAIIPRLHDTTGCQTRSDNCVEWTAVRSTGCQTGLYNRFVKRVERTANVRNRLSNRVVQPVWQPAVYKIQLVVKWIWQPVECLYTRHNRLSNRFDNQLYGVYKHLPSCQTGFDNRLYRVNGAWVKLLTSHLI